MHPLMLLAILLPGASADGPEGCDNHGAIVQAGAGNAYACSGACTNHGLVLMVGPGNVFSCAGGCGNEGVVVNALGDHCGDRSLKACVQDACMRACVGCDASLHPPCRAGAEATCEMPSEAVGATPPGPSGLAVAGPTPDGPSASA